MKTLLEKCFDLQTEFNLPTLTGVYLDVINFSHYLNTSEETGLKLFQRYYTERKLLGEIKWISIRKIAFIDDKV